MNATTNANELWRQAFDAGADYLAACRHYRAMPHAIPLDADGVQGLFDGILEVDPADLTEAERVAIVNAYNRGASGEDA
jgi:hypothetical protein